MIRLGWTDVERDCVRGARKFTNKRIKVSVKMMHLLWLDADPPRKDLLLRSHRVYHTGRRTATSLISITIFLGVGNDHELFSRLLLILLPISINDSIQSVLFTNGFIQSLLENDGLEHILTNLCCFSDFKLCLHSLDDTALISKLRHSLILVQ